MSISRTSSHVNSSVECPRCLAMPGQRCTTKDNRPFFAECDAHRERIARVKANLAEFEAMKERARAAAQVNVGKMDPRAAEFVYHYTRLCRRFGLSLSHEDGHGSFIITNRTLQENIDWVSHALVQIEEKK